GLPASAVIGCGRARSGNSIAGKFSGIGACAESITKIGISGSKPMLMVERKFGRVQECPENVIVSLPVCRFHRDRWQQAFDLRVSGLPAENPHVELIDNRFRRLVLFQQTCNNWAPRQLVFDRVAVDEMQSLRQRWF